MNVAGIDVSTFAVDVVLVPIDGGPPAWHRFELAGADAFDRTRKVGEVFPGRASSFWDDVLAVGIEEPAGRNPGFAFRVQGAVLSMIPADRLVEKWMPSQWRKAVGLSGRASKEDVSVFVTRERARLVKRAGSQAWFVSWPQDACDAYCIALATAQAIERQAAA